MVGLTDISLSGTVTSCKLQMYSHYAYCLAAAVLTCFIINVTRTLLTMTVYLGPRFDKIFLIIAGMPYVQRRNFNLGQQGGRSFSLGQQGSMTHSHGHFRHLLGITSSISVASVLLKQKQKNILEHERILCFNKQKKTCKEVRKYLILVSLFFSWLCSLNFLCLAEMLYVPLRRLVAVVLSINALIILYILFSHSFYWSHDHRVYLLKLLMTFLLVWWTSWHFEWSRISWHFEYDEYVM